MTTLTLDEAKAQVGGVQNLAEYLSLTNTVKAFEDGKVNSIVWAGRQLAANGSDTLFSAGTLAADFSEPVGRISEA